MSNGELPTINVRQPKERSRTDIQKWETAYPALKRLNDETLNQKRGYVITTARCVELCGTREDFEKIKQKWRECVLWVLGITADYSHKHKGYVFVTVEKHLGERYQKKLAGIERTLRKQQLEVSLISDDDFTSDHQRRLRLLQANHLSDNAGRVAAQREQARVALTRPDTLPRLPVS